MHLTNNKQFWTTKDYSIYISYLLEVLDSKLVDLPKILIWRLSSRTIAKPKFGSFWLYTWFRFSQDTNFYSSFGCHQFYPFILAKQETRDESENLHIFSMSEFDGLYMDLIILDRTFYLFKTQIDMLTNYDTCTRNWLHRL